MKTRNSYIAPVLALLLVGVTPTVASTIYPVTYEGPGAMDAPVDVPGIGTVWAGPYNLLVNGFNYSGPCLTWDVEISHTWEANVVPLSDFSLTDQTKLLETEWLSQQFAGNPSSVAEIHMAIWYLSPFGSSSAPVAWNNSWVTAAEAGYPTVNRNFALLVPVPVGTSQVFAVDLQETGTPEPTPMWLFASGAGLIAFAGWFRGGKARKKYNR